MLGGWLTVIVATEELTVPMKFPTRTQKDVVADRSGVVNVEEFSPTGFVVTPAAP